MSARFGSTGLTSLLEGPKRLLREFVRELRIDPASIDRIEVKVGSAILVPRFINPEPRTFASLQNNMPHAAAMLLQVPVGPTSPRFAARSP